MARQDLILASFNSGEWSPTLYGRTDLQKYYNACRLLENFLVKPQGGAQRRPGSYLIAETKYHTKKSRLIPFRFSTTQAYQLEVGHEYIRFYMDNGQIVVTANDVSDFDPTSSYTTAGDFVKVGDYISLDCGSSKYLYVNASHDTDTSANTVEVEIAGSDTLAVTYTAGAIKISLANATAANNKASLIQAALRASDAAVDDWYVTENAAYAAARPISGVTLAATALIDCDKIYYCISAVTGNADNTSLFPPIETTYWTNQTIYEIATTYQETDLSGLVYAQSADTMYIVHPSYAVYKITRTGHTSWTWTAVSFTASPFTGADDYPSCVEFFEQRLFFAGTNNDPQKIWGSKSADYENMTTGSLDDDALEYTTAASKVNAIRWMVAKDVLLIGTVGAEWRMGASSASEPITPTNILCRRQSAYGSALVQPAPVGQVVLFLQAAERKIRELVYNFEQDTYLAPDMSLLAEHMTESGIIDMAYQQEPDSILWCVLKNGYLAAMTYQRDQEVVGWHRHITQGKVESVATIPSKAIVNVDSEVDYMEYASDGAAQAAYPVVAGKELDYMEYATNVLAQAAYVSSDGGGTTDGLCAYYKLDEISGVRYDETANNNDLTDTATLTRVAGKLNYAVEFASSGAKLLRGASTGLPTGDSDFTVCGWFKKTHTVNRCMVSWGTHSNHRSFGFTLTDKLGFYTYGEQYAVGATAFSLNVWHWACCTYKASTSLYTVYLDNSEDGTQNVGNLNLDNAHLGVGGYFAAYSTWTGTLDDIAIFNRVLTDDERNIIYNSGNGKELGTANLLAYSEDTIKQQGDYSLKGIALITESLNDTLTHTIDPTIDLTGYGTIKYAIRSNSRTGSNIKISIHDSGGTTTEHTANISATGDFETQTWDISAVANADKDAIDEIKITIINADAENTFYIDNIYAEGDLQCYSESTIKEQGSYSLKIVAAQYKSDEGYFLRTFSTVLNMTSNDKIVFSVRASRTGENFKLQIKSDTTGVITEKIIDVLTADAWQTVEWDISGVAVEDKEDIKYLYIVITDDTATNTIYLDDIIHREEVQTTGEDTLSMIVKRNINGVVKRFVEYLKPQAFNSLEDAFFVDCGLTYEGSPATTISGLDHLIGKEVVALADGLKVAPQTVDANGEITLAVAARKVHAGLAFLPKIQTMNLEAGSRTGTAQGKIKRIHEVKIRFKDTVGCKVGYDENSLESISGTTLFSGDKILAFPKGYERDYFVMITQPDPLPAHIIAVMPSIITEDN